MKKEAGTVGSPSEVAEIGASGWDHVAALRGRSTTQPSVHAPLIIVGGKSIQLALEVGTIPEEDPVEIFTPEGPDQPLDERVRAGYERNCLNLLDL